MLSLRPAAQDVVTGGLPFASWDDFVSTTAAGSGELDYNGEPAQDLQTLLCMHDSQQFSSAWAAAEMTVASSLEQELPRWTYGYYTGDSSGTDAGTLGSATWNNTAAPLGITQQGITQQPRVE